MFVNSIVCVLLVIVIFFFFFFNDTATTEIYTLSLHDALPILTTLLRLKQVCNHPAHYLMDGSSLHSRSGKLDLLAEMMEEALDEGDRCLVFTQFKEMGSLLKTHLEELTGRS